MSRPLQRIASLVVGCLAVAAVVVAALIVTGRASMVVTHGVSMNPVYYQGDLVVVTRQPSYGIGDIVAYRRPGHTDVVLHRIIGGTPSGWVFKGDNNQSVDPTKPVESQLVGKAILHVSQGGTWLRRFTSTPLLAAYAFLLLMGGGGAAHRRRRHHRKDTGMAARHRARPAVQLGALPPSLRPVAATAAAVGVAGLALSALAWTRPTTMTAPARTAAAATMTFSYTAHVARSAAYDGTTVTAPEPVFRKLASSVDVTYTYAGRPGRLAVTAELSSGTGWHTTLPLTTRAVGSTYAGSVRLDLDALQRRADAATRVTGLPTGSINVDVVPAVALTGGGTFTPKLTLALDPLTLKPSGPLTASSSTKTTGTRVVDASISAAGRHIGVGIGRTAGLGALVLALIAAAALAALARLHGPVAEAERIRARYGQLILPVLPIALQPGRPVVDVPDVASLARLAERYGLLVLQWSHGGVDTYVVQDEGSTYRYRTPVQRPAGSAKLVAA
jgi:signal peptidase I